MRWTIIWLCLALAVCGQGQVFRFGWRDEVLTSRVAENLNASGVDAAGNLVVAGTIQLSANQVDVIVKKYDPRGAKLWEQRLDIGGAKLVDSVQGLVINSKGEIFVSAGTPKNGFDNFVLIKLAPTDGRLIFQNVLDSGNNRATVNGVAIDQSSGAIVQVGGYGRNAREAFFIVKWSESGEVLWKKTWTNDVKGDRAARGLAVSSTGDIFAVGYSETEKWRGDSTVVKLSAAGEVKWAVSYRGGDFPTNDTARTVTLDASGNPVVGGDEYVSGSQNKAYLAKLNGADGAVLWKTDILEPRGVDGTVVAAQTVGNATLVAAQINPTSAGKYDMAVLKFDANGKEVWRAVIDGLPGSNEEVASLAVDRYGYSYILSGSFGTDKATKYYVACVDPAGKVAWEHRDAGPANVTPAEVRVDSISGHVYLSGAKARGVDDDASVQTLFQAPRAAGDRYTVFEGEKLTVTPSRGVLSNDVFWRYASLKLTAPAKSGTLELASDGSFTFQAPATAGEISFKYELSREGLTTSEATVMINVVKKPPIG